eukprot:GCRY01001859.1.p1 GENE.GCRY01001859.1~~GCRY01001859.1.p1  ORF type:complete len:315 (+),score=41.76 GCRY01001859.1:120-1064(+)
MPYKPPLPNEFSDSDAEENAPEVPVEPEDDDYMSNSFVQEKEEIPVKRIRTVKPSKQEQKQNKLQLMQKQLETGLSSKITSKTSIGAKLLQKMGHVEGTGLGKNKDGILHPIGLDINIGVKEKPGIGRREHIKHLEKIAAVKHEKLKEKRKSASNLIEEQFKARMRKKFEENKDKICGDWSSEDEMPDSIDSSICARLDEELLDSCEDLCGHEDNSYEQFYIDPKAEDEMEEFYSLAQRQQHQHRFKTQPQPHSRARRRFSENAKDRIETSHHSHQDRHRQRSAKIPSLRTQEERDNFKLSRFAEKCDFDFFDE